MNNQQAREHMTKWAEVAAANGDTEYADKVRLVMEFFTNPEFRAAMEDKVFSINQEAEAK